MAEHRFKPVFPDFTWDVEINWSKPVNLEDAREHFCELDQTHTYFYKIVGKRGEKFKLFYIGISERQRIEDRLNNLDHIEKQERLRLENKGYALMVSTGTYELDEEDRSQKRWNQRNVKMLESVLIFAHSEHERFANKKSRVWFTSKYAFSVRNKGFLRDGMHRHVYYGLFHR